LKTAVDAYTLAEETKSNSAYDEVFAELVTVQANKAALDNLLGQLQK